MDGKRYYYNYFSVYFEGQRNIYNPLDYFRMGIRGESFFFFGVEDPVLNQNFVQKQCEN